MGRWPPFVWLLVSSGSLLVLIGAGGDWNATAFFAGTAAIVLGFALAMYLAYHRQRPHPRGVDWVVAAVTVFYLLCIALAALAGGEYALAAAGAALVPLTAAALVVATARAKTGSDGDRDPYPGVGMDDATPLGDTDQHSDAGA
jgi:peptidoglycan/LPS O-acetylase OafA/YrhL